MSGPKVKGVRLKELSYKFYASPDGRKVAARIQGLRRHVLTLYFVVGLVVSVSSILIFSLLKGGMWW